MKKRKRGRTLKPEERICSYCGTTDSHSYCVWKKDKKVYCNKHYNQLIVYGKILEKTIKDSNDYIFENDTVKIILRNKKRETVGECIIDKQDFEEVSKNTWGLNNTGYTSSKRDKTKESPILIHRLIMKPKRNQLVDHIDGNPLNNRRNNLRIVDKSKNAMNSKIPSNNSSGVKGVSFDKKMNKWEAYITINKKKISLGYFSDLNEASAARKNAELKYFGEYRRKEY